jgi:hypothetical protein
MEIERRGTVLRPWSLYGALLKAASFVQGLAREVGLNF